MTAVTSVTTLINRKLLRKTIIYSIHFISSRFATQMTDCIFCKIVAGDAPAEIFYQDDRIIVFNDIKPCSKFHFLAIPKEHISNVNCLSADHADLIQYLIAKGTEVLTDKGGDASDVRMGFHVPPFNSVSHLHLHIISPVAEMSYLHRLVYKPNSWWFSTVDRVLDKVGNSSKL